MSNRLWSAMLAHADASQVAGLSRFFRTAPGEYGEGDRFLGIKVPVTRSVVKVLWGEVSFEELAECIQCEYHEVRLASLLVLVQKFQHTKRDAALQKQCIDFYLANLAHVNNWDLVDLSCYELLGRWLLDKEREILYELARKPDDLWANRVGIVSTMQFLRHNEVDDTFAIAELLIKHPHDLIHKATGWLLREAGKRDKARLEAFLEKFAAQMPRTMLRYAIERFPEAERKAWLAR